MKVVVKPYLFLQQALGIKEAAIDLPDGATVQQLLDVLRREYRLPDKLETAGGGISLMDGDKLIGLLVLVDGHNIKRLQDLQTVLEDGAVISLFPPAAGG